jgi:acyl-CoA reductase-like NAD-dependent aldehyde dehydrogenase
MNKIAEQIEAGSVWSNTRFELSPRMPFGEHKKSDIGTERGVGGLKSYCSWQTLYLKKPGAPMSDPPLVG